MSAGTGAGARLGISVRSSSSGARLARRAARRSAYHVTGGGGGALGVAAGGGKGFASISRRDRTFWKLGTRAAGAHSAQPWRHTSACAGIVRSAKQSRSSAPVSVWRDPVSSAHHQKSSSSAVIGFTPQPSEPGCYSPSAAPAGFRSGGDAAAAALVSARRGTRARARVGDGGEDLLEHGHARERGDVRVVEGRADLDDVEADDFAADQRPQDLLNLPGRSCPPGVGIPTPGAYAGSSAPMSTLT